MDEFRAHGRNLFDALEEMAEWAQGGKQSEPQTEARRNEDARQQFDSIMAGLG